MMHAELRNAHRIALFSLSSGRPLLTRIAHQLGVPEGRHEERDFEDGEHKIRPLESVRGRDVYVVESLYGDEVWSVNDKLLRVLFFAAALKDAGADRVSVVAPYLCYARKDRRTKPYDPVTSRYVASLFEALGTRRLVTVDVHNLAAFQNAFRIPTEHLTAAEVLAGALAGPVGQAPAVVVSPDAGGVKRAEHFRKVLARRLDREVSLAFVEKFRSEGKLSGGALVGDVQDKVAIIVDDLIASGRTLVRAALACRDKGARAVFAAATHGVFAADAPEVLRGRELERVFVLDTIPADRVDDADLRERVTFLDSAPLLATAIYRLHTNGDLGTLADSG